MKRQICRGMFLAALLLAISPANAAPPAGGRDAAGQVNERDAARIVRDQKGGRVLDVKPQQPQAEDNGYRVKVIEDGRVRVYGVDGRTGKIRE